MRCHIPSMAKTPKRPRDPNQLAKMIVDIATGDESSGTLPVASEEKKRASAKGGAARAEKLTGERRTEIASRAAATRWKANG